MSKPEKTVEDYLAGLAPEARQYLEVVREIMREIAPDVVERISYDILKFEYAGTYFYAGAWKSHLGLYPVYPATDALEAEIAPYRSGKDTVKLRYNQPLPHGLIKAIAEARIGAD